ncbi:MAG: tRNA (adenosine(37)-N6)-threonylcarbamoyltransferase complex ATPase subunit type 1 TsaE [Gammaproteobacteria bacterium]|nr:tRNA (adenosine(37)-N6)-threonylcarbamoyltransferase complex ATPase subunit type 1 TsaE [Gammaproteobacteria bacterium]
MAEGNELQQFLEDAEATTAFGRRLADALPREGRFAIALGGSLGAGKSTLARALLRGLGVAGPVPSPTYTLIEPYATARGPAYHMDLYRLESVEDATLPGLEDIVEEPALFLVEWPERGGGNPIVFDLELELEHAGRGRRLRGRAWTACAEGVVNELKDGA